MARIGVLTEFDVDAQAPTVLLVKLDPEERDWSKILYLQIASPWERLEPEEFGDGTGVTVLIEDLILTYGKADSIGIDLPRLYQRHQTLDVDQLIIRLQDLEEVMSVYK